MRRLQPAAFDKLLGDGGPVSQKFAWRRRSACPCSSSDGGSAKFDCPLCDGKGHLWAEEVPGSCGHSNQTPAKAMATFGSYERGDCILTIPGSSPLYGAGQYDRIRSVDSTSPFSEVVRPGLNDRLRGVIVSIDRVFWLDDAGESVIEGAIPLVAADGRLSWEDGGPPAGRSYTVEGVRYDEWFVYIPLAADRNSGVSGLPRKLAARRFDLLGR